MIGNHADMGPSLPAAAPVPKSATETVRDGMRRAVTRSGTAVAQSTSDSESGDDGADGSTP